MAKAPNHMVSLGPDMLEAPDGRIFVDAGTCEVTDLTALKMVHFGTDTVRQLYRGSIKPGVLDLFESRDVVEFAGYDWMPGRTGRSSGYQFRLQNADLGLILLIKSFHVDEDNEGPHLKIEVSPHCIKAHTPAQLQQLLDILASDVLSDSVASGTAIHIALDFQGWEPPADFEARLHCRSKRVASVQGIQSLDWDSESATYGRGQSWRFGAANGLQMALYNKSQEAKAHDKLDMWQHNWEQSGQYDPEKPVWRLEMRFHHSVVRQFSEGTVDTETGEAFDFDSYYGLVDHRDGLWRYALRQFKFLARPGWFDPVWTVLGRQKLCDDEYQVDYKRYHKTAAGFSGKNVELLLGNFISCAARMRLTFEQTWRALHALPVYDLIHDHYNNKGKTSSEIQAHVLKLLKERVVRYGKAV